TECYTHYKDPPTILVEDGVVRYKFVCKRYPSKSVKRARYDTSTSNLVNHAKICEPGVNAIKKFTKGGDYNVGRFRLHVALWVAVHNRSHLAVTDDELVAAFRVLQPNVHVLSNDTVGRDVKLIFELSKPAVEAILKDHQGALHAMLDGWTSPNVLSLVGLIIQYVKDNELKSFLLDMIP
ncbi:hypothetical protein C8F01DRAFT_984328, partial [Mycena amicta]